MFSLCRPLTSRHTGLNLQKLSRQRSCQAEILSPVIANSNVEHTNRSFSSSFNHHKINEVFKLGLRRQMNLVSSPINRSSRAHPNRCYSQSAEKAIAKGEAADDRSSDLIPESAQQSIETEDLDTFNDEEDGLFLTDEQITELSNGDEEIIKKIKYIQLEYSVLRQEGESVPSFMKFRHWKELLPLNSRSKRKKFYLYLFKTEMKQMSQARKKEEKREERLKLYAESPMPRREEDQYGTFYALSRNTLFLRLYDATVNKFFHCKAATAMMHHPPLIIDCSYDEYMTHREAKNCAKQIELLITENRTHPEPYNLYLCNAERRTKTVDFLHRLIPTMEDDDFAINVHEESFMELFPKDRLVYLTPHTRDELEEYNEDDIYIIGGMVDKHDHRPHSLAKAKQLGLRMKRLPLDQYLMWGLGGKSLTLNQMVKIMLDLRYSRGDFRRAFQSVPMRKLCRDFHPYPDQRSDGNETSPQPINSRRERKSYVMEDYELLNRRKGFRRSEKFSGPVRRSNQAVQAPRIRSLFQDDS